MNLNYFKELLIILEKENMKLSEDIKKIIINFNGTYLEILDEINFYINKNYEDKKITNTFLKQILYKLDEYYKEKNGYASIRYLWIKEMKKDNKENTLSKHHKELLNYFIMINQILNLNKINYFHASGFMVYILSNKQLERYHHDIDLYVDVDNLSNVIKSFANNGFTIEHTFETAGNMYRHGLKISYPKINIPIWLSFYEMTENNGMNICEYYEDENGQLYTRRNYNSPLCCKLSLSNGIFSDIPYISMSLDALFCSKEGNRIKDIFDCEIIKQDINIQNVQIIKNELTSEWKMEKGISQNITKEFEIPNHSKIKELK